MKQCTFVITVVLIVCAGATVSGLTPQSVNGVFDLSGQKNIPIEYTLDSPGNVSVGIRALDGASVRSLVVYEWREAAAQSELWDGKNDGGAMVTPGVYFYTIDFTGDDGAQESYNPGKDYRHNPTIMNSFSFEKSTGEITYTLESPALVLMRAGIPQGGPMLAEPVSWEPRPTGMNVEKWDISPAVTMLLEREKISFNRRFRALPESAIIVTGDNAGKSVNVPGFILDAAADEIKAGEELSLTVALNEATGKKLKEERYEVVSYVDGKFISEEEYGYSPYKCVIPAAKLAPGVHVITINIATLTDRIGSESAVVKVE